MCSVHGCAGRGKVQGARWLMSPMSHESCGMPCFAMLRREEPQCVLG